MDEMWRIDTKTMAGRVRDLYPMRSHGKARPIAFDAQGQQNITINTLQKICKRQKCTPSDLLT